MTENFIEELRGLDVPENIIVKIHNHFSGNCFYVPKSDKPDLAKRNAEIARRFNGKNFRQLATEFNLSAQHIHKIIKDERGKSCTSDCRQGAGFERSCTGVVQ